MANKKSGKPAILSLTRAAGKKTVKAMSAGRKKVSVLSRKGSTMRTKSRAAGRMQRSSNTGLKRGVKTKARSYRSG